MSSQGYPVRALVVTYRRPHELALTLQRLSRQTLRAERTIVIDNDPDRGAEDLINTPGSHVEYLSAGSNLGPAGGLSLGVRLALSDGFTGWVLFVDDDNYPPDDSTVEQLRSLGERLRRLDTRVAAVGLTGARFDRSLSIIRRIPDLQLDGPVDVDCVGGGQFPLYWSEALIEVGGPDPSLFFGFDDLELGLRLRSAAWRMVVDGDALLRRRCAGTTPSDIARDSGIGGPSAQGRPGAPGGPGAPWRRYYSVRNLIIISRDQCTRMGVARASVGPIVRSTIDVVHRQPAAWSLLWASIRGVADGWLGRTGRSIEPT